MSELTPLLLNRSMIAEVECTKMSGSASWKSCKLIEDWKRQRILTSTHSVRPKKLDGLQKTYLCTVEGEKLYSHNL